MNISVCTVAYNEAEWIAACIRQFKPFHLRHLILVSDKPWYGEGVPVDETASIARDCLAEVVEGTWANEAEQRNRGLEILSESGYVLIVDADELYAPDDIEALLAFLANSREPGFRVAAMQTYWKTPEHAFVPAERWEPPVIALNPKEIRFLKHRQVPAKLPSIPVTLHHMSWVKSDAKVREKIQSFSHADQMRPGWLENIWLRWHPGPGMEGVDVSPYGGSPMFVAPSPCPLSLPRVAGERRGSGNVRD